jgi:hypothetical protein
VLHGFAGSQAAPAWHVPGTQAPPLQTFPTLQASPSGLLPLGVQEGSAVAVTQVVTPVAQTLVAGWHTAPATHVRSGVPPAVFSCPHDHEHSAKNAATAAYDVRDMNPPAPARCTQSRRASHIAARWPRGGAAP